MRVIEVQQEAGLDQIQSDWNTLLRESASDTIFLTWEWVTSWWRSYGTSGELRILMAYDAGGVLRGIAPLRRHNLRQYGQTVRALSFIGDGSNDSDYLDFIVASSYEQNVLEAFAAHLATELNQGTVLLLNEVPANSPNLAFLKEWAEAHQLLWKENEAPCGAVQLPETWEQYLSALRPRFRTKVRSVLRNLESRSEVQFGFCENSEQVNGMLPVLFDLHLRRWALDGKPGVFGGKAKRNFYFALSALLLQRGWLRFSWLRHHGRVLATQYGFLYRRTYFHLQEGYEPASLHWHVGIGLRAWTFREFLKQGVREYDFLGGVGRHKTDWGAQTTESKQIVLANLSFKNVLFCCGPEWQARSRESVKKMIPERILATRRAFLQEKVIPNLDRNDDLQANSWSIREWSRQAAATCYFRLKAPMLARGLREKYQLSIRPRFSLKKRTEPAARILYYHRVNDDRDPFYPATPTAVFEQQMRFLAEHYKVVGLGELQDHLHSGSPETVLALTFDDGYEDNYLNAFPILQRYRLPATIFLTTGSIDSREPLWFEQLAGALKTTTQEFIDVEIDLPRRFWLRTRHERLQANTSIFQLLRRLPDSDRRSQLFQIVENLIAEPGQDRNGRMLTWDQIRLMKANSIDFGGHTVTHPFLSKITPEQVGWEISECKRRIEEELQFSALYFAYPNGREEDFGTCNKDSLRNAGYSAALTTVWGVNYRSTDPMELRRGQPWEQNLAMFAYKLDWYELVND